MKTPKSLQELMFAYGNGGGISLLKEYKIDKSFLTEKEQKDIVFALQSLNASNFPDIENTLSKISHVFKNISNTNWIEIDFSYWGSGKEEKEKFNILKEAILSKRLITFNYYNSYGTKTNRVVEALKLVYKGRSWYLHGFCREKQDYRIFRISRLQNLTLEEDFFERKLPDDLIVEQESINIPQSIKLKLKFLNEVAYRVYDDFSRGIIEYSDDKTFILTIEYPYDEWVIGYILSFGSSVQVIEPKFLKEIIVKHAEEIVKKYN